MHVTVINRDGSAEMISAEEDRTLLEVLQEAGKSVFAYCGGTKTCGRCKVLVRDDAGIRYELACETKARDGIEIILENSNVVDIAGMDELDTPSLLEGSTYGIAADIGTTTMVFHLVDMATRSVVTSVGKVNPQVVYGGDVISRISSSSKTGGLAKLSGCLTTGIREACECLCEAAGVNLDDVTALSVAGNTTMQHFACGLDPKSIGVSPFTPQSLFGDEQTLFETFLPSCPRAYLAPAVAGYVGGDITAGILAARMNDRAGLQLFVDIGTNGEMALGNKDGIVCCATAAGPAFEGANITLGVPAMAGAVCRVSLNGSSFSLETVGGAPAIGICGSGLLDAIAVLVDSGLVDETGRLRDAEETEPRWNCHIGEENGETVCCLDAERNIYLTQSDVRKVQLAKSAIRAGIETMMADLGVSYDQIDEVALAGGFGMHLDPSSAATIGLIPPALADKVRVYGNTAGRGAVECLFADGRRATKEIAQSARYIELSTDARFNDFFIDFMGFDAE